MFTEICVNFQLEIFIQFCKNLKYLIKFSVNLQFLHKFCVIFTKNLGI